MKGKKVPPPKDVENELKKLYKNLPFLNWARLRFIGNLRVLTISYIIGIFLALPKTLGTEISAYLRHPWIIWPLVLFVICVGLGNVIYELACPVIVKKFESPAVFYENQLRIKKLQKETYPDDPFDASLYHVGTAYYDDLKTYPPLRWCACILYGIGLLALLFLLIVNFFYLWWASVPSDAIFCRGALTVVR